MAQPNAPVEEPFPIFKLAHRYILYDANTITYIRAKYNVTGVLIGGLPQAPQQNVFLGIPLELMPEEARLLCEKGVAYIQDDVQAHKQGFMANGLSPQKRQAYQAALRKHGQVAAEKVKEKADDKKKAALSKKLGVENWNDIPEDMLTPTSSRPGSRAGKRKGRSGAVTPVPQEGQQLNGGATKPPRNEAGTGGGEDEDDLLFAASTNTSEPRHSMNSGQSVATGAAGLVPHAITPTTSYPPLHPTPPSGDLPDSAATESLPDVPPSYPLYKHLHDKEYFLAPGLRFGCQYMAYPGDPLRFHSHFLCNGMGWDQEFDLLDIVGGGRLGTGVKKGFLIGGEASRDPESAPNGEGILDGGGEGGVRTFCIEWGGM